MQAVLYNQASLFHRSTQQNDRTKKSKRGLTGKKEDSTMLKGEASPARETDIALTKIRITFYLKKKLELLFFFLFKIQMQVV